MRSLFKAFAGFSLLLATFFGMWLVGSCDKPFEPVFVDPEDYIVYLTDANIPDSILTYHSLTGVTAWEKLPKQYFTSPTVSADGELLYFGTKTTDVIETDSFTLIRQLPFDGTSGVSVSRDNRLMAILGSDGLYILNSSDYSVLFHDTVRAFNGVFSHNSSSFYFRGSWSDSIQVTKVDIKNNFAVSEKWFFEPETITRILPSFDERRWFLSRYNAFSSRLPEVYDAVLDSVIFQGELHPPGPSRMVLSTNGRYLFYTYPCPPIQFDRCVNPGTISVFDVYSNRLHKEIDVVMGDTTFPNSSIGNVGPMTTTPDGMWIIGTSGDYITVIDAISMKTVRNIYFDEAAYLSSVSCQLIP